MKLTEYAVIFSDGNVEHFYALNFTSAVIKAMYHLDQNSLGAEVVEIEDERGKYITNPRLTWD